MLQVVSCNLNGIRSAARKGFFDWLIATSPDVLCVQETKAQMAKLDDAVLRPAGYHAYFTDAEKPGYSGVGIYSKREPDRVHIGLGLEIADSEGRYIQADFGDLSIASLYMPSGTSGDHRQAIKYQIMDHYFDSQLQHLAAGPREFIICGDWNIAHKQIDIKNWRGNQKNSGFLPEERAWMDKLFDQAGMVDAFRVVNQQPEQYTWWSFRGQARANNTGWRIDYQVITPGLRECVVAADVYREQQFSDHAPLIIDYDWAW